MWALAQVNSLYGMNKAPNGGGGIGKVSIGDTLHKVPKRLFVDSGNLTGTELKLGMNASEEIMTARACPGLNSPKRSMPMEIDTMTPPKKGRKNCQTTKTQLKGSKGGKKLPATIPHNQLLLKDVWKLSKSGDPGSGN